jgi:hypothetical protein
MNAIDRRLALNVHRAMRATDPTVHIFLQRMIRQPNGMLAVTPVCTSLEQIEKEVRDLQLELELILQEARQAYVVKGTRISA